MTPAGTGILYPAKVTTGPSSRVSSAVTKFIAGDPMKPATKRFTGDSNSCCGVSTCWSRPSRMTQTRWPSVMASTWSWVT